jgi:hypothetical protein
MYQGGDQARLILGPNSTFLFWKDGAFGGSLQTPTVLAAAVGSRLFSAYVK